MSWTYCIRTYSHTEGAGTDAAVADIVRLGCETEREAKAAIRRFRALGYELYDDETDAEFAGDLKTVYRALSRFAVLNSFTDVAGYELSFRRDCGKYKDAENMIECEEKLSRAGKRDVAEFCFMRKFLGLTLAVSAGLFVAIFIVALIAYAAFDAPSGGAFSVTVYVLFWVPVSGVGLLLFIGVIYGILARCGFAWCYRLSRLRRLVKKDRREIEKQSEAGESDLEDGAGGGLGVEDNQDFVVLSLDDDDGAVDRKK